MARSLGSARSSLTPVCLGGKYIGEVSRIVLGAMAIFTFPRRPTKYEDTYGIRKDIVAGTSRDGKVVYFVRGCKKHTPFYDRCVDIVDNMERNDASAKRERDIERAVRLLRDEGAQVTWQRPLDDKPTVRISDEEARATLDRAERAGRR